MEHRAGVAGRRRLEVEHVETVVIGGGQAGLAVGYHLARRGPAVRDPGRQRARRRRLAQALGLAAPVHARRATTACPGMRFPAPRLVLPHQGRDGRLPRGLRGALRAPGPHGRARRRARDGARAVRASRRASGASRPTTSSSPRGLPDSRGPGLRRRAGPADRAAALERVPQPCRSCATAASSWSARATPAPTSRSTSPTATGPGCPGEHPGHLPFNIEGTSGRLVVPPSCGSSGRTCSTSARRSAAGPGRRSWPAPRRSSASSRSTSPRRASSASRGPRACVTGGPCSRTAASWTSRT